MLPDAYAIETIVDDCRIIPGVSVVLVSFIFPSNAHSQNWSGIWCDFEIVIMVNSIFISSSIPFKSWITSRLLKTSMMWFYNQFNIPFSWIKLNEYCCYILQIKLSSITVLEALTLRIAPEVVQFAPRPLAIFGNWVDDEPTKFIIESTSHLGVLLVLTWLPQHYIVNRDCSLFYHNAKTSSFLGKWRLMLVVDLQEWEVAQMKQ